MKKVIAVLILAAAMACAATDAKKSDKKAAPKTQPPPAVTIPKDAVPLPNGTFGYTDKQGKKWIYAKTPFGIMKIANEEASPDGVAIGGPAAPPKVIDKGDVVRFERPGPFGTTTWEKKKSDLTDEERQFVDSQTAKPEANPATAPENK